MRDDFNSQSDTILTKYIGRIENLGLPPDKEEAVVKVLRDYSKTLISNPLGYKPDNNISDQIKSLFINYKLIASNLSDLFFILDPDLKFTFITPSIEDLMEFTYQELIGVDFDILVPKWSGNNLASKIKELKLEKPNVLEPRKYTLQLSSKYGRLNWYEVQITAICDNTGELKGYNGVCRDINERLKYEESLRCAKFKAEESDRLKSAFLANMSHEIRTPLNGIIGFSTMINNKKLPEAKKMKYSSYIISCSNQLLTIINDIIDISKIEARQLSFLSRKVDLHAMLQEIMATGEVEKERLDKPAVDLILELGQNQTINLEIDDVRLKQVLFNLITNALKFTNNGCITVGYSVISDKNIRFFVKDTGMGIPEYIQTSIFDRFSQGDQKQLGKISGTGLGLAISKGIVELFGGQIGLASEKGKGAEFFFTLPLDKYIEIN